MRAARFLLMGLLLGCKDKDDTETNDTALYTETETETDTGPDADPVPDTETDCADGEDNDQDGQADCADDDCADACVEDCTDEVDNDQDGLTDCADDDCVCVESDCYDGVDDDADGLLDCEDDDCVDVCIEDCGDEFDNDQDGRTDCADDECFGVGPCPGPYRMRAEVTFEFLAWATGDLSDFGGKLDYNYNIAVLSSGGQVRVTGAADGWAGPDITCEGYLQGGFDLVNFEDKSYPDMFTYIGPASGVDYALGFQPTTANGSLLWDSSCPVSSLSYVTLGFTGLVPYVYANRGGKWQVQYTGSKSNSSDEVDVILDVSQTSPIQWRSFY